MTLAAKQNQWYAAYHDSIAQRVFIPATSIDSAAAEAARQFKCRPEDVIVRYVKTGDTRPGREPLFGGAK